MNEPLRYFIGGPDGITVASEHQVLEHMGVPPAVNAGYDLLTDDGMEPQKAADILMAAHRGGRDVEAFARHMLKLRRSLR